MRLSFSWGGIPVVPFAYQKARMRWSASVDAVSTKVIAVFVAFVSEWVCMNDAVVANMGLKKARFCMLIIDTFDAANQPSRLGTQWLAFSDQVMGGRSQLRVWHDRVDGRACLSFAGMVRLENRGGFIQVALPLVTRSHPFRADHFSGIQVVVKGYGTPFYLHLKTASLRLPWEHFEAPLPVAKDWQTLHVPFAQFVPRGTGERLDLTGLTRLGIVAGKAAGEAHLAIAQVAFY